jgi:DNA repair exonuclease SbcCD ATPase subunit
MNTEQIKNKLISKEAERNKILSDIKKREKSIRILNKTLKYTEEARIIIQIVAQKTQQELEYQISEIVTLALGAVFDDPYEFKIEFVIKRGKTEAIIKFVRDGHEFDPLDDTGGGAADIASFALRIALWNLLRPRSRNTLILDEPFKNISKQDNLQEKSSEMLSMISKKLGIQIIMVTHSTELIKASDKVFEVKQNKKKVSIVREV